MNKTYIFPTFNFKPVKLEMEVQRLHSKYKHSDQLSDRIIHKKLPDILARIRELENEKNEIIRFANKLKQIDINILSSVYPYENEDETTISKIILILIERYKSFTGRRFWKYYHHFPFDIKIVQMLEYVFQHENENFLALKPLVRKNYNEIFNTADSNNVLTQLAKKIGMKKKPIEESFSEWKINKESKLSNELWLRILETYIQEKWFVGLHGADIIAEKLKNIKLDRYKKIIVKYLGANNYKDFNHLLFSQLIDRLKDPRKNKNRWDGIPVEIIDKVEMRLMQDRLSSFFKEDSERFHYWQRYIEFMHDIKLVEEPLIAAMYFRNFVVVEFANKGNAAYFYERDGFSNLAYKLKSGIQESQLKNPDAAYFINKLNHSGHWPSRYDDYMLNYLNGNFYYHH